MRLYSKLRYVGFFAIGTVLGIAGIGMYQGGGIVTLSQFFHSEATGVMAGGPQTLSCIAREESDGVIFVSCGGIY